MRCAVFLCVLVTVAILLPGGMCDQSDEQELVLRRNRRTIQFLVNHFVHFLGLSGGTKKIEPKQDNAFALPLTSILKASAGKFSGASGGKPKPMSSEREPTLQHDLPTWIEDRPQKVTNPLSEALEAESLEPTRVSLLSSTQEPEEMTTTSTTTTEAHETTTPEAAPVAPTEPLELDGHEPTVRVSEAEEPNTDAPVTGNTPQDDSAVSTSSEATPIDPAAVNTLSDTELSVRNDVREEGFQPTPIPLVSYQHYVQPAVWPGAGFQHSFPMHQYFGNNVFFPPQHQPGLAFQAQPVATFSQGYPTNQPVYDNKLYYPTVGAGAVAQPKSHSRVKLHDNHYDFVTYHDDSEAAASNYQSQSFGNYRY